MTIDFGETLATMVAKGYCTLEDLDQPSPGYLAVEKDRIKSNDPCDPTNPSQKIPTYNAEGTPYDSFPRPTMTYPKAPAHRNLAREWIKANPKKWDELCGVTGQPERVQVTDPRDFEPEIEF